jgi:energy-converting hydrogenase B subunit Q
MARQQPTAPTVAVRIDFADQPAVIARIASRVAAAGGTVRTLSTVRRWTDSEAGAMVEVELETEGLTERQVAEIVGGTTDVRSCRMTRSLDKVFGKRLIVIGGGAQIAQAVLGAVSEADRHNLRGERISVDTIPLVGEENLANAVRAVADLDRARALLLAGSIMGGEITSAVRDLQKAGIPVVSLNMVGSVTDVADLVVTDPVQAGTMAVMGIADTAKFDFARQKGRRY